MKSVLIFSLFLLSALAAQKLLYVEEVVRHGARAPSTIFDWAKNPEDNWHAKMQLSDMGMRQHYLIGQEIRDRYIIGENLTSTAFNKDLVSIVSTDTHRTIESAES